MRFPGYSGDFGESPGMRLRLNPVGFEDERVKWNWDDIVVRKISRIIAIEDGNLCAILG